MLDTQLSEETVNIQANATAELLRGGFIDVMTAPKPKTANIAIDKQVVLVTMRFSDPAFISANDGVIVAESVGPGIGMADGEPIWFRAYKADHKSPVWDGTVGKSNANMILPVKKIVEGMTVTCGRISHTVVKSTVGV